MKRFLSIAFLIGGIVNVTRLMHPLWINWLGWHANVHSDPSVAQFYSDGCLINGAGILLTVVMALALFWVIGLRPAESAGSRIIS